MSETQTPQAPAWRIETWFPDLDPKIARHLKTYFDELMRFNRTVNLISPKTVPFADVIHFADSIYASRLIQADHPDMNEIYDFGSGNGFPGLIFAMLYPSIKVMLVDSDQRKTEFLKHVAASCQLQNVTVLNQQIEKLPLNSIKFVMSRGFASISKSILIARKIVSVGGVFYHLKGETWPAEVGEIPTQLCSAWTPALVNEYKLPIGTMKFAVVKTTRIGS